MISGNYMTSKYIALQYTLDALRCFLPFPKKITRDIIAEWETHASDSRDFLSAVERKLRNKSGAQVPARLHFTRVTINYYYGADFHLMKQKCAREACETRPVLHSKFRLTDGHYCSELSTLHYKRAAIIARELKKINKYLDDRARARVCNTCTSLCTPPSRARVYV